MHLFISTGVNAKSEVKAFDKFTIFPERKYNEYTFRSSPDQSSAALLSETDAPLLSNGNLTEISCAQYFKVPLEDRSKYEKLVTNNEISSEYSSNDEGKNVKTGKIRKRRRVKNIPEKLQSVCKNVEIPIVKNFIAERSKATASDNKQETVVESDDSIGSASDLRVYDDVVENHVNKGDEVSESIVTCGSSAYHAECESMATHEDDCLSRVVRAKQKEQIKQKEVFAEDVLFVGHQYGEKPLLLDDELDSDPEAHVDFSKWPNKKEDMWIKPSSSFDDDVFAMAPFHKPKNKTKQSVQQTTEQKDTVLVNPVVQYSEPVEEVHTDIPDATNTSQSCHLFSNTSLNPFLDNNSLKSSTVGATISLPTFTTFTVNANIEAPAVTHIQYYTEAHFPVSFHNEEVKNNSKDKTVNYIVYSNLDSNINTHQSNLHDSNQHVYNVSANVSKFSDDEFTKKDNFQNTPFETTSIISEAGAGYATKQNSNQELVYKGRKEKKKEKSKYQLIEERSTDDDLNKSSKVVKCNKKVNSKSSKKPHSKAKTQGGFSNMSFEDYPSDDGEIVGSSTTPFEVVRNSEQEDRRYGSLKRIGNPFS